MMVFETYVFHRQGDTSTEVEQGDNQASYLYTTHKGQGRMAAGVSLKKDERDDAFNKLSSVLW